MPKADNRRRRTTTIRDEFGIERGVIVATLVAVLLVFLPATNDSYVLPKLALLALGAIGLVAVSWWRAADSASIEAPTSLGAGLLGLVLLAMIVATVAGDHRAQSVMGTYGRSDGLITYLAATVLFFGVLVAFDHRSLRSVAGAFSVAGAGVVAYGLLQALGLQPVAVSADAAPVISTLGQANFVGGFLAIVAPFLVWAITDDARSIELRRAAAGTLAALLLVAARVQSFQVLPALIVSLGVTGSVLALPRWGARRVSSVIGGLLLGSAVLSLLFRTRLEAQIREGFDERVLFWQAALDMIRDSPIIGRGFSGFATSFAAFRPQAHAVRFGAFQIADAPHDVPLGMVVSGGALLGVAYLAFVAYVGLRLVQGVRRLEGGSRALLAAVGGAWVGYQAQSLVSIDVPPLILTHFILAAAILVLVEDRRTRRFELPWRPRGRGRSAQTSGVQLAVRGAIVVVALALAVLVIRPVQADLAFAEGLDRRPPADAPAETRDPMNTAALARLRRATDLAPWVGRYWAELAATYVARGDQDSAVDAGRKAADLSPSVVSYALAVAQLAHRMGRDDIAARYFAQSLVYGRDVPAALIANAEFLVDEERFDDALPLAERALELHDGGLQYWRVLAEARAGAGDERGAADAWERVLEYDPTFAPALAALGRETG